jgi:hypothetical protein
MSSSHDQVKSLNYIRILPSSLLAPNTPLGSLCGIWFARSYRWFVAWWPNIAVWMDVVFRASASRHTCRLLLPCMGRHLVGGVHISALFAGSHTEIFVDPRTGELMLLMVPVTLEITCFFFCNLMELGSLEQHATGSIVVKIFLRCGLNPCARSEL